MKFKIGFTAEQPRVNQEGAVHNVSQETAMPRRSVVQVYFAGRNMSLAYYNDSFDLHPGDLVYVDGKLEGMPGRVTDVNYNFKIKVAEYKRVVAVADTNVRGQFFVAGSHFVTFNREALPCSKVRSWYMAPAKEEDEYVNGYDDTAFRLDALKDMDVSSGVAERGREYYLENRVRYISLNGSKGYAIVEGRESYEVEFDFQNGEVSRLMCSCFCSYNCKHQVAVMLQLKETLEYVQKHYADEYERTGYFAAIGKGALFAFAIDGRETGSFTL
ncbi:MAG: hypothetical protein IJO77_01855 [Oscillospiraceae bacterium]|nr:hypothetical protein [Oscillospiraceae bacterium]